MRVALEGFEAVTEVEAFVKNFGTGPQIPGKSDLTQIFGICPANNSHIQTLHCLSIIRKERRITERTRLQGWLTSLG